MASSPAFFPVVSPSLLESITVHPTRPEFSLGMEEWTDSYLKSLERNLSAVSSRLNAHSSLSPPPPKSRPGPSSQLAPLQPHPQYLSLASTANIQVHPSECSPPAKKTRFSKLSKEELDTLSKACVPKNTENSTKWALENFNSWMSNRNESSEEKCPETLLEDMEPTSLNKWLSIFIAETRKVNGEPYPPTTLQLLLSGLQRHMKAVDKERAPNIFAKNDVAFQTLHHTMDSVYRKLRADGVGAQKQSTETFTKEEENQLWACGVLGVDNPTSLLRAVFFNNGKNFCLRGGNEHRNLRLSQLRRTENGYTYTENASKNRSGGLAQLHIKNKSVQIHENPEAGDRCHCRLLDLYISKLPPEAVEKDLFYVRPMEKVNKQPPTYERSVWYYSIPLGRNKLSQMVPEMCKLGNISGHKTNHSLRATGATELYEAQVPEKIIQERTGHRSLECLRMYERTSDKQQQAVSNILSSHSQSSYHAEMTKLEHKNTPTMSTFGPGFGPNMKFDSCQVNININHGSSAPVNFTSSSSLSSVTTESCQTTSELGMPSAEDILQFLKDLD